MILEFSKLNTILYLLLGSTTTFAMGHYFFGLLIVGLGLSLAMYMSLQGLKVPEIIKYQNVFKGPSYGFLGTLILVGLYIISQSTSELYQKALSTSFLVLSISFYYAKVFMKGKYEIFNNDFINEIPSLLFMVYLFSVTSLPDSHLLLKTRYNELKEKLGLTKGEYEF